MFRAEVKGFQTVRDYEDVESFSKSLKVFIEEAKEADQIVFTLYGFKGNKKARPVPKKINKEELLRVLCDEEEGLSTKQLIQKTKASQRTIYWYLELLRKEKKVFSLKKGGSRRYFVSEKLMAKQAGGVGGATIPKTERARREWPAVIYTEIEKRENVTTNELLDIIENIPLRTLYYHLERMRKKGIIEHLTRGGSKAYYVTPNER